MDKRVLIVDDSASWRAFNSSAVRQILQDDFVITTADTAKEAVRIINENIKEPFHLVITDLQMELGYEPFTAGEWLVKNIQNIPQYACTKVIIISAMYNIGSIAAKLGVEYVRKSVMSADILPLKLMLDAQFKG
ncbi:MAG: response regulator [Candidatus Gastranaerophilales bacterium]|nr:response regulator [Candidatus Gastranaerophilales bacterium]